MAGGVRWAKVAVLGVTALALVAACSGEVPSPGATTTTTLDTPSRTTDAVVISVPTPARYVRGSDGKVHLETTWPRPTS